LYSNGKIEADEINLCNLPNFRASKIGQVQFLAILRDATISIWSIWFNVWNYIPGEWSKIQICKINNCYKFKFVVYKWSQNWKYRPKMARKSNWQYKNDCKFKFVGTKTDTNSEIQPKPVTNSKVQTKTGRKFEFLV
jgi:hypothetical protein